MTTKIHQIIIGALLTTTLAHAGGDNRVTMTDVKESIAILIEKNIKNELAIDTTQKRLTAIEPAVALTDKNTVELRNIKTRLNELGVPSDAYGSASIWNEIKRFIGSNKSQLPGGGTN